MQLRLSAATQSEWTNLLGRGADPALQQDWAYGDAVEAQGHTAYRLIFSPENRRALAAVQLLKREFMLGISAITLMRGPVWLDATVRAEYELALLRLIQNQFPRSFLFYTPENAGAGVGNSALVRHLPRIMTGHSTCMLDLNRPLAAIRAAMHGKWRNMLRRAEDTKLKIERRYAGFLVDWLIENNERYRKKIGYRSGSPDFYRVLNASAAKRKAQFSLIAMDAGQPVAGVMVHQHGHSASYVIGYTSPEGRQKRAHHRLLWQACQDLKNNGIRHFDLGRVDTVNAPGLTRFKLGLGGRVVTYAGTFMGSPRLF